MFWCCYSFVHCLLSFTFVRVPFQFRNSHHFTIHSSHRLLCYRSKRASSTKYKPFAWLFFCRFLLHSFRLKFRWFVFFFFFRIAVSFRVRRFVEWFFTIWLAGVISVLVNKIHLNCIVYFHCWNYLRWRYFQFCFFCPNFLYLCWVS